MSSVSHVSNISIIHSVEFWVKFPLEIWYLDDPGKSPGEDV